MSPKPTTDPVTPDDYSNPWTTLESTTVYENQWIHVREDQVLNPAGSQGIYGVVHFKSIAVGIIPIDHEQHTWLVGQYRYPLQDYSWEIPMGGAPEHADPLEGAIRELKEETGLTAGNWHNLMKLHPSNSVSDEGGFVYVATDLTLGDWEPEETEQLIIKRVPLQDAVEMALTNEITDCISISGLLRLQIALERGELSL